jgi:hypothetical protein
MGHPVMRLGWERGHIPGAKEAAEKVRLQRRAVPQRLKPRCKQGTDGTAEAVPLTKQEFFRSL